MHPDGRGRHRRALRQVYRKSPRRKPSPVRRRGVARARKGSDGLKNSISDFTSNEQIKGASSKDVVDLLLITQYFDMLNAIGTRPDTLTVFIDEDGERMSIVVGRRRRRSIDEDGVDGAE